MSGLGSDIKGIYDLATDKNWETLFEGFKEIKIEIANIKKTLNHFEACNNLEHAKTRYFISQKRIENCMDNYWKYIDDRNSHSGSESVGLKNQFFDSVESKEESLVDAVTSLLKFMAGFGGNDNIPKLTAGCVNVSIIKQNRRTE